MRVSLRPLAPDEESILRRWCPRARGTIMALDMGGELVGAVGYLARDAACEMTLAVVAPRWRGLGLGSEGVRALEEALAGRGVRRFRAHVPLEAGLAFYFWLRLGYRPLKVEDGAMVMAREVGG